MHTWPSREGVLPGVLTLYPECSFPPPAPRQVEEPGLTQVTDSRVQALPRVLNAFPAERPQTNVARPLVCKMGLKYPFLSGLW